VEDRAVVVERTAQKTAEVARTGCGLSLRRKIRLLHGDHVVNAPFTTGCF
jgi:hypothetical protein